MPIEVSQMGSVTSYEEGASFEVRSGVLLVLNFSNTYIGAHAECSWSDVKVIPEKDIHTKLEEALELLSLVDSGKFLNQDDDWQERTKILLDD